VFVRRSTGGSWRSVESIDSVLFASAEIAPSVFEVSSPRSSGREATAAEIPPASTSSRSNAGSSRVMSASTCCVCDVAGLSAYSAAFAAAARLPSTIAVDSRISVRSDRCAFASNAFTISSRSTDGFASSAGISPPSSISGALLGPGASEM
jgi:hypothetical protein